MILSTEKKERLQQVEETILSACQKSGRKRTAVKLIAVSKTKGWEEVRDFLLLGQTEFGENYVQEAISKIQSLQTWKEVEKKAPSPHWHFIGNLQSNKTKFIPGNFSLFHALDSLSLAEKLNKSASAVHQVQNCLVEVNLEGQSTKGGISPKELPHFLEKLQSHSSLTITGLMCIPDPKRSSREPFSELRQLQEKMNQVGAYKKPLTELSMGMSADFSEAILEGSTMVRVGTALFGARS